MREEIFTFKDSQGVELFVYKWLPETLELSKGVVQLAHGMAETAERYRRFAEALTQEGYIVYANDHRGHGKTAKTLEKVGFMGRDGFNWMVKDLYELNCLIRNENSSVPVYLMGHSMGSFLTQSFIYQYGEQLNGAILSGTAGKMGPIINLATWIAKREVKKYGEEAQSTKLNRLSFGGYNKSFKPVRTEFDWLSRDEKEVDKYIEDPFCGGIFSAGYFYDLLKGLKETHKWENMDKIPKELPIYVFSGEKDPVGSNTKTVIQLINTYKTLGIKDVSYKFYKDGRHEMLNELNKAEVTKDVIDWLKVH